MTQDDEIVSVANEPNIGLYQTLVKNIENDVRQQRGDNAPLRRAMSGRKE